MLKVETISNYIQAKTIICEERTSSSAETVCTRRALAQRIPGEFHQQLLLASRAAGNCEGSGAVHVCVNCQSTIDALYSLALWRGMTLTADRPCAFDVHTVRRYRFNFKDSGYSLEKFRCGAARGILSEKTFSRRLRWVKPGCSQSRALGRSVLQVASKFF